MFYYYYSVFYSVFIYLQTIAYFSIVIFKPVNIICCLQFHNIAFLTLLYIYITMSDVIDIQYT